MFDNIIKVVSTDCISDLIYPKKVWKKLMTFADYSLRFLYIKHGA